MTLGANLKGSLPSSRHGEVRLGVRAKSGTLSQRGSVLGRIIHYAVDASTIGGKDRLLGFLTSNKFEGGAWLPPQAMWLNPRW